MSAQLFITSALEISTLGDYETFNWLFYIIYV